MDEEELLVQTLQHLASKDPEEIVRFFYKYLIELNKEAQEDDVTFVVADFELEE
ncbi:SpoIIE family protein phosphatase [Candidatus Woesearchaeota archaeon]|nr:SpoIIE family protein phosphatase [Candidatus Woesearchaeota archaeon]